MKKRWQQYIHTDLKVLLGKPVIRGTRISVELILDKLASGETVEQILESHPHITRKQIAACLAYAADTIRNETTYRLAS